MKFGDSPSDVRKSQGVPPATLAEFTFDGTDDWYDGELAR
jgi:hypothetical protein